MASSIILILFSLLLAVRGDLENALKNEIFAVNSSVSDMGQCGEDLKTMVSALTSSWALKMLDATSKIRSGFGVLSDDIGQFDECLGAVSDDGKIKGKYCLGSIEINGGILQELYKTKKTLKENTGALVGSTRPSHPITWAACLPSSCNSSNFANLFSSIIAKTILIEGVAFDESMCYTQDDDTKLTTGATITIVFFCIVYLILLLATGYDVYCQRFSKEPNGYILAFSMYTNSKKLFTMSTNNNQLECLNGLKFYSMLWVVTGHTFSIAMTGPMYNYLDLPVWTDKLYSMLVISGTLSVDTFFLIGGALVAFVYLQTMAKGKKFNIIMYYLHRYIRLTPALGALLLVVSTVYPYLGSGPYWSSVRQNQEMCQRKWWATLFYFQNYDLKNGLCAGHSWYLAVDMQLFIISPFILYSLRRFPKYTLYGLAAVILGLCGMNFGLAWNNTYPAVLSNIYIANTDFMMNFYIKTHTRANVWLTGIIIGYMIHQMKQKKSSLRLNKILILVIWGCALATLLICIFIGHDSLRTPDYNQWGNSLHIALWRECWAIALSWLIIACISGYGGPINWLLSLPVYQVFNRFAYSIYIVHYMFITLVIASARSPIFFSDLVMGYYFWGNLCFTCIISYFWVLAFESPVINLEKLILAPLMK